LTTLIFSIRAEQTSEDGSSINTNPVYFDIRFSNVCNFRCRICGPWSSHSWFNDAKVVGYDNGNLRLTKAIDDLSSFFEQLKKILPQTEEIYFAGGEPTLMEEHYALLDLLLVQGLTKINLQYNANFSTLELGLNLFSTAGKSLKTFLCALV
jgi:organic radical activating enzyme